MADGSVKSEMEDAKAERRAEREDRIAAGLEERGSMQQRMRAMQRGSRARMSRFQGQLQRLAKRRKRYGQTSTEVVAAATELGLSMEDVRRLEEDHRENRRRLFPRRRKKTKKEEGEE